MLIWTAALRNCMAAGFRVSRDGVSNAIGEVGWQFQKYRFAGSAMIASPRRMVSNSLPMRHLGIACGGDDNYATGIAVALYSALSKLSTQVTPTVYVMDGGLSSDHRQRLEHVITKSSAGFLDCLVPDFRRRTLQAAIVRVSQPEHVSPALCGPIRSGENAAHRVH